MTSGNIYQHHYASTGNIHVETQQPLLITSTYVYQHHAASNNNIHHTSTYGLQQPALMTSWNIYQHHTASAGDIHVKPATTCIDDI